MRLEVRDLAVDLRDGRVDLARGSRARGCSAESRDGGGHRLISHRGIRGLVANDRGHGLAVHRHRLVEQVEVLLVGHARVPRQRLRERGVRRDATERTASHVRVDLVVRLRTLVGRTPLRCVESLKVPVLQSLRRSLVPARLERLNGLLRENGLRCGSRVLRTKTRRSTLDAGVDGRDALLRERMVVRGKGRARARDLRLEVICRHGTRADLLLPALLVVDGCACHGRARCGDGHALPALCAKLRDLVLVRQLEELEVGLDVRLAHLALELEQVVLRLARFLLRIGDGRRVRRRQHLVDDGAVHPLAFAHEAGEQGHRRRGAEIEPAVVVFVDDGHAPSAGR